MTYPLSSAVSVGDATEASQYNNLRADALCLGNDPDSSGNLLQLLAAAVGHVSLSRTSATGILLSASETSPCAVVIGGKICAVTEDLSLSITEGPPGGHGRYFLYAQAAADGAFRLIPAAAAPENSRPVGTFLWDGEGVISDTVRTMREYEAMRNSVCPSICCGRLSASASAAVPEGDLSTSAAVYFHPWQGNQIGLYVGTDWEVFTFTRRSLALSELENKNVPHDIFMRATKNGLVLTASAWASVSARSVSIGEVNGIRVLSSDPEQRYLGTIMTDSQGRLFDSTDARMVWNQYNRVCRPLLSRLQAAGTAAARTGEWVRYFGDDAPAVRVLLPFPDAAFELTGVGISERIPESDAASGAAAAVGLIRDPGGNPLTSDVSCVPVFTASRGNAPITVTVRNSDSGFRGAHTYTLAFWTNTTLVPGGNTFPASGECPGLYGKVMG